MRLGVRGVRRSFELPVLSCKSKADTKTDVSEQNASLFVRVPTHSSQIQMQDESTNFVLQGEAGGRALLNL